MLQVRRHRRGTVGRETSGQSSKSVGIAFALKRGMSRKLASTLILLMLATSCAEDSEQTCESDRCDEVEKPTIAANVDEGWMFPSSTGTLRTPSTFKKAWTRCSKAAGVTHRFTVHGMRYTFSDLIRRADVDPVVRRALTGHVTEEMQQHYSNVGLDEKRAPVAGALRLVSPESGDQGGDQRKSRSAKEANRPVFLERDKGFEPSTSSLGR